MAFIKTEDAGGLMPAKDDNAEKGQKIKFKAYSYGNPMLKTKRAEMLWHDGGTIYVYLCYGIHWLINIVSGIEGDPQAVLIRCCLEADGPGKLTKALAIDGSFNGMDILSCPELWLEDDGYEVNIISDKRVGIAYADEKDRERLWRFKHG